MKNIRDDLASNMAPGGSEGIDPVELARRDQKKSLPRRFYKEAGVQQDGDFCALVLDGKRALTPARNALRVPSLDLAQALADEWQAQQEYIDPGEMPLTRLVNTAIDSVAREQAAVVVEIVKYAGSDLLCYRAADPAALVQAQTQHWDPILEWLQEFSGAQLNQAEGVMFVEQPVDAISAIAVVAETAVGIGPAAPFRAAALNVITTLTGSAVLALAVAHKRLIAQEAWNAAHVDEDFQMRAWGEDDDALARRARRWREMEAAGKVIAMTEEQDR